MKVSGKNACREILNSEYKILNIYLQDNFKNEDLLKLINKKKLKYSIKTQSEMDKMAKEVHQGIIIEIEEIKCLSFDAIKNDNNASFVVLLDHIEDPRNLGAIIRTCECAGVDYCIIPKVAAASLSEGAIKTSAGAIANIKIVMVSNLRNAIDMLKKQGFWVTGLEADGQDYTSIDYKGKCALVVGSEGFGLKQIVRNSCDMIASIPLKGKVNSLNASVAAGIVIYEALRQRNE